MKEGSTFCSCHLYAILLHPYGYPVTRWSCRQVSDVGGGCSDGVRESRLQPRDPPKCLSTTEVISHVGTSLEACSEELMGDSATLYI